MALKSENAVQNASKRQLNFSRITGGQSLNATFKVALVTYRYSPSLTVSVFNDEWKKPKCKCSNLVNLKTFPL